MLDALNYETSGVLKPDFILTLGSKDITGNISSRLISMTMTDNRGFEADQLDIVLDDSDGLLELPTRGASLSLYLGYAGYALIGKGSFTVDEIEHRGAPDTVTIRARSADFRGSLNARREESWHDTTLGAIVESIAGRNRLQASVIPALAAIKIPHIDQSQESDASFLTRLAERNGAEVSVKAGKILLLKAGGGTTASGTPIPQVTISRSDGDSHQFAISDRNAYTGVTARWLDAAKPKQQKQAVKFNRKLKAPPAAAVQHPKAQSAAASQGKKEQTEEYMAGEASNVFAMTTVFASREQALRAAEATWSKIQRGTATFTIKLATGWPDIYPETPVQVKGFKQVIDDHLWTIVRVTHTLDGGGYVTSLNLEVRTNDVEYELDDVKA